VKAAAIHPGAEVECNVLGRVFAATVTGKPAGGKVEIEPPEGITYRCIRVSQISKLLRRAEPSGQLRTGDSPGQAFDPFRTRMSGV
jgi:hypothetical protein